ncbi:MAG: hypothetical protein KGN02_08155 [bacterium]|nr:hypothetical protein [bacterium]
MHEHDRSDWEYGLFSGLSLEFLARAALARVSPTLLADKNNWQNTYHALGFPPRTTDFVPRSRGIAEIFQILAVLVPGFSSSQSFCVHHIERRNSELHSGTSAFESAGDWLPKYYMACKALLAHMGLGLADFFKDPDLAEELIAASQDAAAKSVRQDVAQFRAVWMDKTPDDREQAARLAEVWASKDKGHRAACPACQQVGLLRGTPQGDVSTEISEDDEIIQKQTVVPSTFECIACGFKVSGLAKLAACGLGTPFKTTSTRSAADFFGLFTEDDVNEALHSPPPYDDDNNE